MKRELLPLLACPKTHAPLVLSNVKTDKTGNIVSGTLTAKGHPKITYPIVRGVPRFAGNHAHVQAVHSFGEQWNFFNYTEFKHHFENHSIKHTFGKFSWFKGKTVVDCGAGAGMQTRWLASNGAKHVIALELSHTVDGVLADNLKGLTNVDVIQCSIDAIPLREGAIKGLVMCHNVIQHTASVPNTLAELWRVTAKGGEMCFNVYTRNDSTLLHRLRHQWYLGTRWVVSRLPFPLRLGYAHLMSLVWFVPVLGKIVEKADMMRSGDVPNAGKGVWHQFKLRYRSTLVNTFDYFGAHTFQYHCSFAEIKQMVKHLKPKATPLNADVFYRSPQPIGAMLRLTK